jgi:hypothetical protein
MGLHFQASRSICQSFATRDSAKQALRLCGMGSRRYKLCKTTFTKADQMPQRLKSLIGTLLIICLVIVYALVAVTFATVTLGSSPWYVHLLYFFFTGLLWILPAMWIVKWMAGGKVRQSK